MNDANVSWVVNQQCGHGGCVLWLLALTTGRLKPFSSTKELELAHMEVIRMEIIRTSAVGMQLLSLCLLNNSKYIYLFQFIKMRNILADPSRSGPWD